MRPLEDNSRPYEDNSQGRTRNYSLSSLAWRHGKKVSHSSSLSSSSQWSPPSMPLPPAPAASINYSRHTPMNSVSSSSSQRSQRSYAFPPSPPLSDTGSSWNANNRDKRCLLHFRRKASKEDVERVRHLIIDQGGIVRDICILPYKITASVSADTIKQLDETKAIKKVERL